jgi:hypothetical protein
MKYIIYLAASFILFSCSSPFLINTEGYSAHGEGMSLEEAWKKTSQFTYMENDENNYWKSPHEFEADGGGDCEDFCIYLMYLTGRGTLINCTVFPRTTTHYVVYIDGKYIESIIYHRIYSKSRLTIIDEISWYDTMLRATLAGVKTIEK